MFLVGSQISEEIFINCGWLTLASFHLFASFALFSWHGPAHLKFQTALFWPLSTLFPSLSQENYSMA